MSEEIDTRSERTKELESKLAELEKLVQDQNAETSVSAETSKTPGVETPKEETKEESKEETKEEAVKAPKKRGPKKKKQSEDSNKENVDPAKLTQTLDATKPVEQAQDDAKAAKKRGPKKKEVAVLGQALADEKRKKNLEKLQKVMSIRKARVLDKILHGEEVSDSDTKPKHGEQEDTKMKEDEVPIIVVEQEAVLPPKTLAAEVDRTVPRKKTTPSNTFKVKSAELKQKIEMLRQQLKQKKE